MEHINAFVVSYNKLFTAGASDFFFKYLMSFSGLLFVVFCLTIIKAYFKKTSFSHMCLVTFVTISYLSTDYLMALEYLREAGSFIDGVVNMYLMFSLFDSITALIIALLFPFIRKGKGYSDASVITMCIFLINSVLHLILMLNYITQNSLNPYLGFFYSITVNINDLILLSAFLAPTFITKVKLLFTEKLLLRLSD
ncbi:hypothetical protein NH514_21510 [Pseudoalteromonas sp. ACER1]|jgi:hypothetical protein|uniref:hypothetical protein n=1 Tax=Pseudoalteromonas TaxID=53246 RepID=UPI0006D685AB|nr:MULTISPECIES: hypothetical protein [Pseudoalteromonas]KPZ67042.1 hypothetical protein AN394_03945 [Pseudoalteromonas sp. P1-26]MCF2849861.1 hypothetical protein [Pseudoalteromonas sp. PAST1]MCF2918827.1 hypothetical protein [Pseudoalteromonas sp. Cn5-37]MCO7213267.1 hypothetical protein [Pseudoalteromonas sp. ACER1]MCO7252325.1 hypothetical protein [Pseudoalteromonas sp. Ps84H-4]|tara:strand:+ start:345 stop:932 length:588 start_codon:yes stop_codon:yes gene_type:complete